MLDKSVPYKNIIMRIDEDALLKTAEPKLPDGYRFELYRGEEDIKKWAEIETSVLEFPSEAEAESYFKKTFLPLEEQLKERCLFVVAPDGTYVATTTAWYTTDDCERLALLHWVSVRPDYQGLGLGKSVVQKALLLFQKLEPGLPAFLHTQTWSHPAVRLYHKLGFRMLKTDRLANNTTRDGVPKIYDNDYAEAIEVLKTVLDKKTVDELAHNAT